MKIQILGTRGEIEPTAPYHAKHSGVLIDDYLMFDLGEKEFLSYKPKAIFITHLHPDHAYFVRDMRESIDSKIKIYAPERFKNIPMQVLTQQWSSGLYMVTPIPTEHSIKVKSQAYLIQKGDKRILYTGDMFWIIKKYQKKLKKLGKLDLVITEASFLREGGVIRRARLRDEEPFGHAGIPNLIRFFKPYTKEILLMHFGSWFYQLGARAARVKIQELVRRYDVKIYVGYDGLILCL